MDRLRASTVAPSQYQAARKPRNCHAKKASSRPFLEHDDEGLTQMRIKHMPLAVLTDRLLQSPIGSPEACELSARCVAMVRG